MEIPWSNSNINYIYTVTTNVDDNDNRWIQMGGDYFGYAGTTYPSVVSTPFVQTIEKKEHRCGYCGRKHSEEAETCNGCGAPV